MGLVCYHLYYHQYGHQFGLKSKIHKNWILKKKEWNLPKCWLPQFNGILPWMHYFPPFLLAIPAIFSCSLLDSEELIQTIFKPFKMFNFALLAKWKASSQKKPIQLFPNGTFKNEFKKLIGINPTENVGGCLAWWICGKILKIWIINSIHFAHSRYQLLFCEILTHCCR